MHEEATALVFEWRRSDFSWRAIVMEAFYSWAAGNVPHGTYLPYSMYCDGPKYRQHDIEFVNHILALKLLGELSP